MTTLFRAISQLEKDDYDANGIFKTGRNTLDGKQFFRSRTAVLSFVNNALEQDYDPPYAYLLIVSVDDEQFDIEENTQDLDGYLAVHVDEDHLQYF